MKSRFPALLAALALSLPAIVDANTTPQPAAVPAKIVQTKEALRDLWIGHAFWVRNVVTAQLAGDSARAKAAEQEVVANAQAIAGSIEPFYGKAASDQLFKLLAGHWGAIKDYLIAASANNTTGQSSAEKALAANANEIASFLAGANPNFQEATLRSLLAAHGAHHVQQIQQFKAKRYEDEAKTWAAMKDHLYVISDALATGIAKQFPDKFR